MAIMKKGEFKKHKLVGYDCKEENGTYTIYLPCNRKTIPVDLTIEDWDGKTRNCYLQRVILGDFYNSKQEQVQMYKCSYKRY